MDELELMQVLRDYMRRNGYNSFHIYGKKRECSFLGEPYIEIIISIDVNNDYLGDIDIDIKKFDTIIFTTLDNNEQNQKIIEYMYNYLKKECRLPRVVNEPKFI